MTVRDRVGATLNLNAALLQSRISGMGFLNEVADRFPEAVSLAPGRPDEALFGVEQTWDYVRTFVRAESGEDGFDEVRALNRLGQYGPAAGLVNAHLSRHLEQDERIIAKPDDIVVTTGCQEAMLVLALALRSDNNVLLQTDPSYVGMFGASELCGLRSHFFDASEVGLTAAKLREAIDDVRRQGLNPAAIYDVPNFNNPLGTVVPDDEKKRILEVLDQERVLLIEDNPYGAFAYDDEPPKTFRSLGGAGSPVIYLGSFSKTMFPSLRIGYLVSDQLFGGKPLAAWLSTVKSMTTVNTPALMQAAAAGFLLSSGGSLGARMKQLVPVYRARRDALLTALEKYTALHGLSGQLHWSRPSGGFFLHMTVPFEFDEQTAMQCAEQAGVICCPMSMFSALPGRERQIRLAFSYVPEDKISLGVERLLRFIAERAG